MKTKSNRLKILCLLFFVAFAVASLVDDDRIVPSTAAFSGGPPAGVTDLLQYADDNHEPLQFEQSRVKTATAGDRIQSRKKILNTKRFKSNSHYGTGIWRRRRRCEQDSIGNRRIPGKSADGIYSSLTIANLLV